MAQTKDSPQPDPIATAASDLQSLRIGIADNPLTEALPVPDLMFGGTVLVIVIAFHAFWIRFITSLFLTRASAIEVTKSAWRADVLFIAMVIALLTVHLSEVVLWSAALVLGGLVPDWSRAAYFAANCYTALGEPFSLAHAWRVVPPIIAMSGIFAFGWTASVFVNFVARYNELRAGIIAAKRSAGTPKR
ncbi:MAG: hypothetical protein KA151_15335 [Piscinibacter sp.]|nr:hypothetical protein [Piscinibacter sp.]